jgi:aminoacrylate hydrolase
VVHGPHEERVAVRGRLGDITCPVLLLSAADDMLVASRASEFLAGGLPYGEVIELARGGHACNVTEPARFNQIVLDWLAGPAPQQE